jgi:hypothetical protein
MDAPDLTPPRDAPRSVNAAQASAAWASDLKAVEKRSASAAEVADWVIASGDNTGRPFMIVDKLAAEVFVFDAAGRLLGDAPVLVGLARGDDSVAGIGDRDLAAIRPEERTTPAGRFVTGFGPAAGSRRTVLWVDYATAVSLHPVVVNNPKERRLERIRSPDPGEHRITFGCINVPTAFYKDVVLKAFAGGVGVVYVLPDTKPLDEVFPAVAARVRANAIAGGSPAEGIGDALTPPAPSSDPTPAAVYDVPHFDYEGAPPLPPPPPK